jgi:hypothetical protein
MLATKIVCPNCARELKTPTPLPVGRKVLCRQCGTTFGVQPVSGDAAPAPTKRPASAAPAPIAVSDNGGGTNKMLLIGGVIGGVALFMVLGSAAVVGFAVLRAQNKATADTGTPPATTPALDGDDPNKTPEYCPPVVIKYEKPTTVVTTVETTTEKPWLPKEDQEKVDKAIERGLEHLKKLQHGDGSWDNGNAVGMTALPALTLLECGVKADDPQVVKAANFVRKNVPNLTATYQLSLSILFLDRLADPADKGLIQTMALRLIAGQTGNGGWHYNCPLVNATDEREILELLQDTRPAPPIEIITQRPGGSKPGEINSRPGGNQGEITPPGGNQSEITRPGGNQGEITTRPGTGQTTPHKDGGSPGPGQGIQPGIGNNDKAQGKPSDKAAGNPKDDKTQPNAAEQPPHIKRTLADVPTRLRHIPALQVGDPATRNMTNAASDNSNTQFALLAIWVSGRHDVPTERTCALIDRRFRTSQANDGGWGYPYEKRQNQATGNGSPAMTCAGLLGLAVGHGVAAPNADGKSPAKEGVDDAAIKDGLKHLTTYVGISQAQGGASRGKLTQGMYFLWSVERVGVMYNLRSIGNKDWYAWGTEALVDSQAANGGWNVGGYPGNHATVDTCFALLFLKRANLAKDLTTKIEYLIDIKGVGNRN